MKKLILFLFLFFLSQILLADVGYLGIGYNLSSGSFKNFNYVIDRYNETREALNLDPEMKNIHFNHGMTFEFGYMMPHFQGGFGLQYSRAKTHAKLVDSYGVVQQRDLWLRAISVPFELGIALGEEGLTTIPGFGINFIFWRYFTRSGEEDEIKDREWFESAADVGMQLKLYVKFVIGGIEDAGFGFIIEPYFNLGLLGCDMESMNSRINPETWVGDPEKMENFTHYGVRLMLILKMG